MLGRAIQTGFSQNTNLVATLNGGQTFLANLANPFPNGVLAAPRRQPGYRHQPRKCHFILRPAREACPTTCIGTLTPRRCCPARFLLEVGYHGTKPSGCMCRRNINALPDAYLSTLPVRDQATVDYLSASIPNPLAGLLPGTSLNGATIGRSSLLVPFPEFGSITVKDPQGYTWFHALQVRLERRFSHGFTTQVGIAFSKLMEAVTYLNAARPCSLPDHCQRGSAAEADFQRDSGIAFRRGKRLLGDAGRLTDRVIGGWQVGAIWTLVSGPMVDFGNCCL